MTSPVVVDDRSTSGVAPEAMAYSSRDAKYVMNVHGRWDTAAEDQRCIAWAREFFAKSQPFASAGAVCRASHALTARFPALRCMARTPRGGAGA